MNSKCPPITQPLMQRMFKDIGTLFNYIARVFSAGSSIINNVVTIVDTVKKINSFVPDMGSTKK